jgi:RimJ/RimL family protein N-acetyltransferase
LHERFATSEPLTVMLRDVIESDLPIFFEHQRDPVAVRMAAFRSRELDAFMTHWHERVLGTATNRAKTIEVDGRVAGNVGSWEQDGKRLVGYWIGREHWGRGIATRALTEFLAHDLTRPLHAWVAVDNPASIRVLEKCGFLRDAATPLHAGEDGVVEVLMTLAPADGP